MITLSAADKIVICGYFVAVLVIGFLTGRKSKSTAADYLLAGRSLTLPVFVMTLVTINPMDGMRGVRELERQGKVGRVLPIDGEYRTLRLATCLTHHARGSLSAAEGLPRLVMSSHKETALTTYSSAPRIRCTISERRSGSFIAQTSTCVSRRFTGPQANLRPPRRSSRATTHLQDAD